MAETLEFLIALENGRTSFHPGDIVSGTAELRSPHAGWRPNFAELILFWRTEGAGNRDEGIVGVQSFVGERGEPLPALVERSFRFELPAAPWTYQGRIVKIQWYLGAYARGKGNGRLEGAVEVPLVVHPNLHMQKR